MQKPGAWHIMRSRSVTAAAMCGLLVSCATPALWQATDPHEFVAVSRSKTNEEELKARGLQYRVDEQRNLVYVEKTKLRKSKDYVIRALATPVTVALDAATTIAVVGAAVYVVVHSNDYYLETTREDAERAEWASLQKTLDAVRAEDRTEAIEATPNMPWPRGQ